MHRAKTMTQPCMLLCAELLQLFSWNAIMRFLRLFRGIEGDMPYRIFYFKYFKRRG